MAGVSMQQPAKIEASDPVIRERIECIATLSKMCFDKARSDEDVDVSDEFTVLQKIMKDEQLRQLLPSLWPGYVTEFIRIKRANMDANDMLLDAATADRDKSAVKKLGSVFVTSDKSKAQKLLRRHAKELGSLTDNMLGDFAGKVKDEVLEKMSRNIAEMEERMKTESAEDP